MGKTANAKGKPSHNTRSRAKAAKAKEEASK